MLSASEKGLYSSNHDTCGIQPEFVEGVVITIAMSRDPYADLVRAFPPRPIHTMREYNATVAIMNKLAVREEDSLSAAEQDYLDALSTFVQRYDEEHFPQEDETSPLERLQYLIEQAGISASDLGRLLGNRGLGSILLTGKRELSKAHIRVLADHFKINPSYFF